MSSSVAVSVTGMPVLLKGTATVWAFATGVPTATFSVTVAGALVLVPLLAVKVKLSDPW